MILTILATCVLVLQAHAQSAEIIFADGRHELIKEPKRDAQGRWTALRDGRRTTLRAGEIVVVIDEAGKENITIPDLVNTPDPPETTTLLASLRDLKNAAWRQTVEQLSMRPTKSLHDALVVMASDSKKELRLRAVNAVAALKTKESVLVATTAVLAEKDVSVRRDMAYVLYSVQEIFKRCDTVKSVATGLADKDSIVRIVFAMLSPRDLSAAIPVLRNDGLKNGDHHVRESAATELGRRGDNSGESILIGMLARTKLPGFDGGDALMEKLMIDEQVEVCSILGKLGSDAGKAALKKAKTSKLEAVRKAAEAALGEGK